MTTGRLLLLSDYAGSGPGMGGAGVVVAESFATMRRSGLDVTLATGFGGEDDGDGGGAMGWIGLGGDDLRARSGLGRLATVFNPAVSGRLREVLSGFDPETAVVVLHQWTRWLTPAAMRLLAPYRLMVVLNDYFWLCPTGGYYDFRRGEPCTRRPGSAACLSADCDRAGRAPKLLRAARHLARVGFARRTDARTLLVHISSRSQALGRRLLPARRHELVHNPLHIDPTSGAPPTPSFDIGYFGRIEPEKGVRLLVEESVRRGLRVLLVGDGGDAAGLAERQGVTWRRWCAPAEARELMRQCRAVALPSLWPETWGLVTAEAMAMGVRVLVSRRAGSAELVERFGGGLLFEPGTAELGDALDALTTDALLAPPSPIAQAALAAFLSPGRHARAMADLVDARWGIDVVLPAAFAAA